LVHHDGLGQLVERLLDRRTGTRNPDAHLPLVPRIRLDALDLTTLRSDGRRRRRRLGLR
jgi:hypothetical protein